MTWRQAFFTQARSDFTIFQEFKERPDIPYCQKLHYLQMATEKLAKGYLSPTNGNPPPKTHLALVRFLQISKGQPEIRRKLGFENNHRGYSAYIDGLLHIADQIEQLAPVGNCDQPNSEYPWVTNGHSIISPTNYNFPEFDKQALTKFQGLIMSLFRIIPRE